MRSGRLVTLLAAILILVSAMLAAPVSAVAVHTLAAHNVVENINDHGHSHPSDFSDVHDFVDHVHDLPVMVESIRPIGRGWNDVWSLVSTPILASNKRSGMERPPRSAA